jgi:hydrogenase maturation protease
VNVVVLGLGNPIRTDDGVGIHAIRKLSAEYRFPDNIQTIEGGTLGLDLLPRLRNVSHLLVLDAVDAGDPPGTLSRFAGAELARLPASKSVHLLGLVDLLGSLSLLGESPCEVVLLGVQPHSTEWGVKLSPLVEAALLDLIAVSLMQISNWLKSTLQPEESGAVHSAQSTPH